MAVKLVTVKLNNHRLSVNYMSRKLKSSIATDEFAWTCAHAPMEVNFDYPEGSPFTAARFVIPKATTVYSGPPAPGKQRYRYTLTIRHADYLSPVTIDPEVDVDGGDPNGKKKAAKKKSAKKAAKKKAAGRKKR